MVVEIDRYASIGFALELLSKSAFHSKFEMGGYFRTEIFPPLFANQARFYLTNEGVPTAMATWAWLSKDVETEIHTTGRALMQHEWNCGDRLFFNDWITPYGNIRDVVKDMRTVVFPEHHATSVRRDETGAVKKVCYWQSVMVNAAKKKEAVA